MPKRLLVFGSPIHVEPAVGMPHASGIGKYVFANGCAGVSNPLKTLLEAATIGTCMPLEIVSLHIAAMVPSCLDKLGVKRKRWACRIILKICADLVFIDPKVLVGLDDIRIGRCSKPLAFGWWVRPGSVDVLER
jgi:hypothetical protein